MPDFNDEVNERIKRLAEEPRLMTEKTISSYAFSGGWSAMSNAAWDFITDHADFLGVDGYKVMGDLASRLNYENYVLVNQKELAERRGMTRNGVRRGLQRLLHLNILIEGKKNGLIRSFRFNPQVTWRGAAKTHRKAVQGAPHLKVVK